VAFKNSSGGANDGKDVVDKKGDGHEREAKPQGGEARPVRVAQTFWLF